MEKIYKIERCVDEMVDIEDDEPDYGRAAIVGILYDWVRNDKKTMGLTTDDFTTDVSAAINGSHSVVEISAYRNFKKGEYIKYSYIIPLPHACPDERAVLLGDFEFVAESEERVSELEAQVREAMQELFDETVVIA